jgi:tripartite-type tricarboxylate transporter receptor subunit TctC
MAGALVLKALNCKSVHVPFQGQAPSVTALVGGHIDTMITLDGVAKPYLENQKVKVLAVTTGEKSTILNQVPLLPKEIKGPVFWLALFVNSNAPPEDIEIIKNAVSKTLKNPNVIKKLSGLGYVNIGRPIPEDWIKLEHDYYSNIVQRLDLDAK